MPDAILALQLDHRKISAVLDVVQQQVKDMVRGTSVNYRVLRRAFDYLSGYPDQCHHPKEDLVYRKLTSRCPAAATSVRDLVAEHEKLATMTTGLRRATVERPDGTRTGNDGLAGRLQVFLDTYRHHMLMEEQHFFPLAVKQLSQDDFAEIDFSLFDMPDHAFDGEAEDGYAVLHGEIARLGFVDKTESIRREEALLLDGLHDMTAFNGVMEQYGEPARLSRTSEGGYELKRAGSSLLHIPACSESRAAWCAYFFLKAATMASFSLPPPSELTAP